MTARARTYEALHGRHGSLTVTQRLVMATIIAGAALAILGTEPALPDAWRRAVDVGEAAVGCVFLVEYLARVWSIGELPEHAGLRGRLAYMRKPFAVIDLLALMPFFLGILGGEAFVLRVIRVLRLLAISKMIRYSEAMRIVVGAVIERKFELLFAVMLAGLMILVASSALYVVEGDKQPEAFGSILRSMWWAVVTLTTVGYGDVVPQTVLGKVFAGVTALAGIGMIAMPTGILAASFTDGFARARARADAEARAISEER